MVSFVVVVFYVLTILGIFILRKKMPNAERPYKAFLYPVLPALYIILGVAFCVLLVIYKSTYVKWGLIIAGIGVPIYYIAHAGKKRGRA
jgi:APA family basic amino acid/polyamine antiporter